ncbi:MAG: hypothetical protein OEZ01_14000, partial [Candidatus Heimdallarchaeota archaeon]|nr:hypothetical protein [Candidatus Heimdallarchaeota archaeon]
MNEEGSRLQRKLASSGILILFLIIINSVVLYLILLDFVFISIAIGIMTLLLGYSIIKRLTDEKSKIKITSKNKIGIRDLFGLSIQYV